MAFLNGTFDASQVEPSAPREIIPAGKYVAQIVQSEMRPTKSGSGEYLWMEMEITDGQFAGRRLWERLNLRNPNTQAVEIAQRTLSAICRAVGRLQVSDSEELHMRPFLVTVKVRPAGLDKGGVEREAQNEIGGYEQASLGAAVARAEAGFKKPAQPGKTPPWKNSAAA